MKRILPAATLAIEGDYLAGRCWARSLVALRAIPSEASPKPAATIAR